MTNRRLFSLHNPCQARKEALCWASDRTSGLPHSVLYISPPEVHRETLVEAWDDYGSKLALHTTQFDSVVDRLYEASTYEGDSTFISSEERRWIVEAALTRINQPRNPLYVDGDPSVGLIEHTEELLTLLEFAGLDSPATVKSRLIDVGVEHLADSLSTFVEQVQTVRKQQFDTKKTFRSERYLHVIRNSDNIVPMELTETEVVVVGAFQTLSPLERDLIDALATDFDTAVVCPRASETKPPTGIDLTLSRVSEWYKTLDFKPLTAENHAEATTQRSGQAIAKSLYRYQSDKPRIEAVESNFTLQSYPTVRHESSGIARKIRSLIADRVCPDEICVAVYDTDTYTERIGQALTAADVPIQYDLTRPFFSTLIGDMIEASLELGRNPNRQAPLCRLLANPLVDLNTPADSSAIIREADLLESTRIDTLQSRLDRPASQAIERVVGACERFVNTANPTSAKGTLLASLGIPVDKHEDKLTDDCILSEQERIQESSALSILSNVCSSLATINSECDAAALHRALEQVSIETTVGRATNSVRVCSPTEAISNPYTHVFVPGLTTEHTPSPVRRPAFTRSLNDAHREFEAVDPIQRTRYTFGLLLTGDAEVSLSVPERNANGDDYVHADVLEELQRVTRIEPTSSDGPTVEPATREEIYRSLAVALETDGVDPSQIISSVDEFDIHVPTANVSERLKRGVRLASARRKPDVSQFDGRLSPDAVQQLRDPDAPLSPSTLETYAACGFKFYAQSVLNIESDENVTIELDALDTGKYVHGVLETFYRTWIDQGNTSVTEATLDAAQLVLYEVAVEHLTTLDVNQTAFHSSWLTSLFDGLHDSENIYGDPDGPAGLFRRFLDAEAKLSATNADPSYFEAHVGLSGNPDVTRISPGPIQLSGTTASLHGKIDRIDMTSDGGIIAYDYKTGKTPNETNSIEGSAFQLSAYLLMAEKALDAEPIGAAYYRVNPSSSISYWAGTIGSEADASYYKQHTADPLKRYRTLTYETRDEFQAFLHGDVADRIEQISIAINEGSFHPTVLDPSKAGCEYCDYREMCDVRSHQRHEISNAIDRDEIPTYVPVTEGDNQ